MSKARLAPFDIQALEKWEEVVYLLGTLVGNPSAEPQGLNRALCRHEMEVVAAAVASSLECAF